MSVGNLKDQGNKGNNFPWQLNVLKTLGLIAGSTAGGATEATALAILAAIQSGQEYEQNIVIDKGGVGCPGNCPTYLQVRIWDTVTHTFLPPVYYDASGAVVVPVGPVELVNPQYVLENILTQVTAINADLDVALSTRASEATLLLTNIALGTINTSLGSLATEATLTAVKTVLDTIKLDTANLAPVNTTPGFSIDTTSIVAQPVPTGVKSFSLLFRGTGGQLNGATVPDGYRVDFGNGKDPVVTGMTYLRPTAGTGQEVLISTLS